MKKASKFRVMTLIAATLMVGGGVERSALAGDVKVYSAPPQSVEELEAALGLKKGDGTPVAAKKGPKTRGVIMLDPSQTPEPTPSPTQPVTYQGGAVVAPQPPVRQVAPTQPSAESVPAFIRSEPAPANEVRVLSQPIASASAVAPPVAESEGRAVSFPITFGANSSAIRPASQVYLVQLGGLLHKNPNVRLVIEGHTDASGNYVRNMDLSRVRAQSVTSELINRYGVSEARLTAVGKGPTEPLDPADPFNAANRRVQIRLIE